MGRTPPTRDPDDAIEHSGATEPYTYTYPGLDFDFAQPGAFSALFRTDIFEQQFAMPVDGPIHLGASDHGPPLPSFPHAAVHGLGQGLAQDDPSLTAPPAGTTSTERAERGPFDLPEIGQVFGLETVGSTIAGWQPPASAAHTASHEHPYPQDSSHGHLGAPLWEQDGGIIADGFMGMDDTLAMWPSMSEAPIFW